MPANPSLDVLSAELVALRHHMEAVSLAIHARPELKFAEFHAREVLTNWLAESGFEVRSPVGGVETAFVAVHEGERPGPCVAVLAEYDALPGIGHGCGHNLIAAGAAAAAIAVAGALPGHPGTVAVIGTPGEEMGGAGKVRLADAGVFDEVDAAVMFHPGDRSLAALCSLSPSTLEWNPTRVIFDKVHDVVINPAHTPVLLVPTRFGAPHLLVKNEPGLPPVVHFPVDAPGVGVTLARSRMLALTDRHRAKLCRLIEETRHEKPCVNLATPTTTKHEWVTQSVGGR